VGKVASQINEHRLFVLFIFALLRLLRRLKVELWNASEITIWIGILLVAVGVFTLKIEIADLDKNKCSEDEASR
jgi:hypothetical protein